jgi:hypothetical protein
VIILSTRPGVGVYIFRAGGIEQGGKTRYMGELSNKYSLNNGHLSTATRAVHGAGLVRLQPASGSPSVMVLRQQRVGLLLEREVWRSNIEENIMR